MNHTRFPKEDHLPDWARRDNKVTKGDRVNISQHFHEQPTTGTSTAIPEKKLKKIQITRRKMIEEFIYSP